MSAPSSSLNSRPVRSLHLTAKLKDTSNASTPELSFQRKAVQDFHARRGQASSESLVPSDAEDPPGPPHPLPALKARSSLSRSHTSLSTGVASSPPPKRTVDLTADDSNGEDEPGMQYVSVYNNITSTHTAFITARKRRATTTTMSEASSVINEDDVDFDDVELESESDIEGEYS
jgi:hypothetical protein